MDRRSDREGETRLRPGLGAALVAMRLTGKSLGLGTVSVLACTERLGNCALGHPDDCALFRQQMQGLLHRLADVHGDRRVQELPCAFFGPLLGSYHRELEILDSVPEGGYMVSRLRIANANSQSSVGAVGTERVGRGLANDQ